MYFIISIKTLVNKHDNENVTKEGVKRKKKTHFEVTKCHQKSCRNLLSTKCHRGRFRCGGVFQQLRSINWL